MERIILDTDIGDDIDDALALNYLLINGRVKIEAVTTVFQNVEEKFKMAKYLLDIAGHSEIPVYIGESQPIEGKADMPELNYFLPQMDRYEIDNTNNAVDKIIETVNKFPGDISILAIGPLTNIARAIERNKEIVHKINRLVIMGGAYFWHHIEWNILCDPAAADTVFRSGLKIEAIGTDVTLKCRLTEKQITRFKNAPSKLTQTVGILIEKWMDKHLNRLPVLHDPLAAVWLTDEKYLKMKEIISAVEVNSSICRGMTVNLSDASRNKNKGNAILVAYDVDSEKFADYFVRTVMGEV